MHNLAFAFVAAHPILSLIAFALAAFPFIFGTTVAYPGYGSMLQSGGIAGSSYTKIGQLKKFAFAGLTADFDEITNLDSPTIFKEWMKTNVDGKEVNFDGVLNPTDVQQQDLMINLSTAGSAALYMWKITTTDGSIFTFQGYVSEYTFDVQYNKAITFTGKIRLVGNVTANWS